MKNQCLRISEGKSTRAKTVNPQHEKRVTTVMRMIESTNELKRKPNANGVDEAVEELEDIGRVKEQENTENRERRCLPCGVKPSQREIDDHDLTHIPLRSWCKHCVIGRAQPHPHYTKERET